MPHQSQAWCQTTVSGSPALLQMRAMHWGLLMFAIHAANAVDIVERHAVYRANLSATLDIQPSTFARISSPSSDVSVVHVRPFKLLDVWQIRYSPQAVGLYRIQLETNGAPIGDELTFTCVNGSSPSAGFITVGPNRRHLIDNSTGRAVFLVGLNIAWPKGNNRSAAAAYYESYFAKMQAVGANFARVWLGPNVVKSFSLNALQTHRYDVVDPDAAALVDKIVESAQQRGIRLMLVLDSFNSLCPAIFSKSTCWWDRSVYNAVNGGPLDKNFGFLNFWSSPKAKAAWRSYIQHVVARWGAYSVVAAWQLFNEVDTADLEVNTAAECGSCFHRRLGTCRR